MNSRLFVILVSLIALVTAEQFCFYDNTNCQGPGKCVQLECSDEWGQCSSVTLGTAARGGNDFHYQCKKLRTNAYTVKKYADAACQEEVYSRYYDVTCIGRLDKSARVMNEFTICETQFDSLSSDEKLKCIYKKLSSL